jgi:hypothetical protein
MSLTVLIALAASASGVPSIDPLSPAASGQVQCYQPDEQKKTCRSIASYRAVGRSTYSNTAVVLLSEAPPVILETTAPVTVRQGAVCGAIRAEDIAAGKLRVSGRLFDDVEAAPLLARVAEAMKALINKQICTSYEASGDGLTARASIDGRYRADMDQRVKWVHPGDGYKVAP